jgi:hypothetical protein
MTADEIAALVAELGDIATALGEAEPELKLDLYRSLRLRLTYDDETQTVHAAIDLARTPLGFGSCPRSDTNHNPTWSDAVGVDPVGVKPLSGSVSARPCSGVL